MENKKMTKKNYFEVLLAIKEVKENNELVNFITHEIELLDKKRTSGAKSKRQVENEDLKLEIINALTEINNAVTISELQEQNSTMNNYTNQRLSALLKQLVESGEVIRVVDKKKAYFSVEK